MTFGQYIKQLREARGMTQPDAASHIGIEQSYLSKLENDKSHPSEEMFQKLVEAYDIAVEQLVQKLPPSTLLSLGNIPAVAHASSKLAQAGIKAVRRWMILGIIALVAGAGMITGGVLDILKPDVVYEYISPGVTYEGESKFLFRDFAHEPTAATRLKMQSAAPHWQPLAALADRVDEKFITTFDYRGEQWSSSFGDGDGTRTYFLTKTRSVVSEMGYVVLIMGMMAFMGGLLSFYAARKWR